MSAAGSDFETVPAGTLERLRRCEEALAGAIDGLTGIVVYGNDTLSGRVDGPDDREWQRAGVLEMTNRAIRARRPQARTGERMSVFWKRVVVASLTFIGCVVFSTFVMWGLAPDEWDVLDRFFFGLCTVMFTGMAASFPFKE